MPLSFEITKAGYEPYTEKIIGSATLTRDITLQPAKN